MDKTNANTKGKWIGYDNGASPRITYRKVTHTRSISRKKGTMIPGTHSPGKDGPREEREVGRKL